MLLLSGEFSMGPKTPPKPDFDSLIPEQEASNMRQFDTVLNASRPNITTPTGTTTWTRRPGTVNQTAYSQALADYNARRQAATAASGITPIESPSAMGGEGAADPWRPGQTSQQGGAYTYLPPDISAAPTEDQFRSPDSWDMTQTLSPEEQAIFGADQRNRLSGQNQISSLLSGLDTSPLDMSNLPSGYSSDPARLQQISDTFMSQGRRYLEPRQERQQSSLRDDLLSQGFNYGDDTTQRPLSYLRQDQDMAYNDLVDRSILASGAEDTRLYNQAEGLRASRLAEMLTQRNQPLAMISSLRTGAMPQTQFGQSQYTAPNLQGVDRIDLANQDYSNSIEQANARSASRDAFLQGLMRLAGTGIMAGM
jgi:hypothetical protein